MRVQYRGHGVPTVHGAYLGSTCNASKATTTTATTINRVAKNMRNVCTNERASKCTNKRMHKQTRKNGVLATQNHGCFAGYVGSKFAASKAEKQKQFYAYTVLAALYRDLVCTGSMGAWVHIHTLSSLFSLSLCDCLSIYTRPRTCNAQVHSLTHSSKVLQVPELPESSTSTCSERPMTRHDMTYRHTLD